MNAADLTEAARRALQDELSHRGIADLAAYRKELETNRQADDEYRQRRLQRVEKQHRFRVRFLLSLMAALFLCGAWRLLVDGDRTNGIGIMVACAIALPIVLAQAYVRRALWKFVLRK